MRVLSLGLNLFFQPLPDRFVNNLRLFHYSDKRHATASSRSCSYTPANPLNILFYRSCIRYISMPAGRLSGKNLSITLSVFERVTSETPTIKTVEATSPG